MVARASYKQYVSLRTRALMMMLVIPALIAGCASTPPRKNAFDYHGHKIEPGELKQVGVTGEPAAVKLFLELLNETQPGFAKAVTLDGQPSLNNPHDIDQATWDTPGNVAYAALKKAQSTDQLSALLLVVLQEQGMVTGKEESGVGKVVGLIAADLAINLKTGGRSRLSSALGGSSSKDIICQAKGVMVYVVKDAEIKNKIKVIECEDVGTDSVKAAISKAIAVLLRGQYPENTDFYN